MLSQDIGLICFADVDIEDMLVTSLQYYYLLMARSDKSGFTLRVCMASNCNEFSSNIYHFNSNLLPKSNILISLFQ